MKSLRVLIAVMLLGLVSCSTMTGNEIDEKITTEIQKDGSGTGGTGGTGTPTWPNG